MRLIHRFFALSISLLAATSMAAQDALTPAGERRLEVMETEHTSTALLSLRAELELTSRQITALEDVHRGFRLSARALIGLMEEERQFLAEAPRRTAASGAGRQPSPSETHAARLAAREAMLRHHLTMERSEEDAVTVLTPEQRRRATELLGWEDQAPPDPPPPTAH